ncbi:MAG: alkaline phosphatase family protein [Anaerolineae bacterium]
MKKFWRIILSMIVLLIIAPGSYLWAMVLLDSLYKYESPLKGELPLGQPTQPLVQQVAMVIVDGLRYDTSLEMPYLNSLREEGASGVMVGIPSPASQPAWTTLLSGAGPEINGAPLLDPEHINEIQPIAVDHLFAEVKRAGFTGGLAGSNWWQKMVPAELLYAHFFVKDEDAADEQVVDSALRFLKNFYLNYLLIHLNQVDHASREYGAASSEYRQAALRVDAHLRDIAQATNVQRNVLIVVSDYGHPKRGEHNKYDQVALTAPFVMVGPAVVPGDYGRIAPGDVAPTVAALLGTAVPSAAQRPIRFDMLSMGEVQRAVKQITQAQQRVELGQAYLRSVLSLPKGSIGADPLSETAKGDALVATSSLQVKNYTSAYTLGGLAVQQIDKEMEQARARRIQSERVQRRIEALVVILVPLLTILGWLWWRRSKRLGISIFAALLTLAIYHLLFIREGNLYSPNIPRPVEPFLEESLRRVVIALAVGLVVTLLWLWYERERSLLDVAQSVYGFSFAVIYFLGVQIAIGYWLNGPKVSWYLPDLTLFFAHFSALVQSSMVAVISVLLPVAVLPFYWVALLVRSRLKRDRL